MLLTVLNNTASAVAPPATFVGVFDLFKIGIGPSSSHSVGPMRAAGMFLAELETDGLLDGVGRVRVDLYGSLALTGRGHATDVAVLMGLEGEAPDTIDPTSVPERVGRIRAAGRLSLQGRRDVPFCEATDLVFNDDVVLDGHPNGLRFQAFAGPNGGGVDNASPIRSVTYYSVGGGFVVRDGERATTAVDPAVSVPHPFASARELLALSARSGKSIGQLALENELTFRSEPQVWEGLDRIWRTMSACVDRGCRTGGVIPGGLRIVRRAPGLFRQLCARPRPGAMADPLDVMDWVDLFAIAVSEENAAGGRVVTAPTNGAAGIIPSVLRYYERFCPGAARAGIHAFLLAAAAVGSLYKRNASISGAEVGCQGEVGVACSMAAAGLTEALGGNPRQVEQAAEIGMEHNLGLTCDPIGGLVQVPCIERNAMGAVKAINASRLALRSDGEHFVSLDRVIEVMRRTGADMSDQYKETSQGGLAVNLSEC